MSTFGFEDRLDSLDEFGTPHCKIWRNEIFRRNPILAAFLISGYKRRAMKETYVQANLWLLHTDERARIGDTGLTVGAEDERIKDYGKAVSRSMKHEILRRLKLQGPYAALKAVSSAITRAGVDLDVHEDSPEEKVREALLRACDENWWFKQLRRLQRRGFESIVRELGYVSASRNIYVSEMTFQRRLEQKRSNRALLKRTQATNEEGQNFTLAELSDLSPSNPILRRVELMVRMRGLEDIALHSPDHYTGLFFTLTCPSKYHAVLKAGRLNPKFADWNPLEAHTYLNQVWSKTRSAWDKQSIHPFGMRVVEPHHDGTPHWHLMLFVAKEHADLATAIFRKYALEEDGDEPGAKERRLKTEIIDPDKGSATGYLAKYIAKNIDGFGVDADHYGKDAVMSAMRIEAWASTWGIRQFQQIGGPSVTVWRELRRLDECLEQGESFEAIRVAADTGNWAEYTELMGGAICRREDRPLKPMMSEKKGVGLYGGTIIALTGIWHGTRGVVTRIHDWTISTIPNLIRALPGQEPGNEPGLNPEKNPYKGIPGDIGALGDAVQLSSGHSTEISFKEKLDADGDTLSEYYEFLSAAPNGADNLEYCQ